MTGWTSMPEMLLVSNLLLWFVVLALLFVVFALARQIGVLHERLAPAGAAAGPRGIREGEQLPAMRLTDLRGDGLDVGGVRGRGMLLLFVSPTCPLCRQLTPVAADLARAAGRDLVLASEGGDDAQHRAYVAAQGIEVPYVRSTELVRALDVGLLPFAAVLDAGGVLQARGRVNDGSELQRLLVPAASASADGQVAGSVQVFEPVAAGGGATVTSATATSTAMNRAAEERTS
jgi:methylamine dehydrogenase accessory protein MauD